MVLAADLIKLTAQGSAKKALRSIYRHLAHPHPHLPCSMVCCGVLCRKHVVSPQARAAKERERAEREREAERARVQREKEAEARARAQQEAR